MKIIRIAAGSSFQDRGRPGWRQFGVPVGGAFDRESYELALALVGRKEGPVLEIPMMGAELEAEDSGLLSVVGAECAVLAGKALRSNGGVSIKSGERLKILPAEQGARVYVASQKGWHTEPVLGSVSGNAVPYGFGSHLIVESNSKSFRKLEALPSSLDKGRIRFVPYFHGREADFQELENNLFRVGLASNRVGIRLEGGAFEPAEELVSEPSCPGAIQLVPSGELLVHGPDGPTIGGYPKLGVVCDADLDRLGQLRPGQNISFEAVSLEAAQVLSKSRLESLDKRLKEIRLASA